MLSNDCMVCRFTARAMLAGYRDIEPLYTPEGVLENQPGQFEWLLVHQAGFPKLGVQEALWVLSCGRFRVHWNMLSDSDTDLWVSSILQQCDHLCINNLHIFPACSLLGHVMFQLAVGRLGCSIDLSCFHEDCTPQRQEGCTEAGRVYRASSYRTVTRLPPSS